MAAESECTSSGIVNQRLSHENSLTLVQRQMSQDVSRLVELTGVKDTAPSSDEGAINIENWHPEIWHAALSRCYEGGQIRTSRNGSQRYPDEIDFEEVQNKFNKFAKQILRNKEEIIQSLIQYETYQVACDEISRTLDLLLSINENREYFRRRVGRIAAFLPKNQPLYALTCFGIVPAAMSEAVFIRPPLAAQRVFDLLIEKLNLDSFFSNIFISYQERSKFVGARTAQRYHPYTKQLEPTTEVVIFTGTMENADYLREQFHPRTLFIANGAGHNPIVVTPAANLEAAVESALRVQLYNQGQDCASPSAILVHTQVYNSFLQCLRDKVARVRCGPYTDLQVQVGPLSESHDLERVALLFKENACWLDSTTPGIIDQVQGLVEPTIILKPLAQGGNYIEQYGPIFFVQKYDSDDQLELYFGTRAYARNAMYVCVFGESAYVDNLVNLSDEKGKLLHDASTVIRNTDLHAPGVERGVCQYGGYGRGASCWSLNGQIKAQPTLPQREIFEQLVRPNLVAR